MNDPNSPQYSASSSQPSELRSNSVSPSSRFMSAPGRARTNSSSSFAYPINFRQTLGIARDNGELYFEYTWESSTGKLMDLFGFVYEEVVYPGEDATYYPPNPPFATGYSNPTLNMYDADVNSAKDTHFCPRFSQPYRSCSFEAYQTYIYRPVGMPEMILMGPLAINRSITQVNGKWEYQCSKSGVTSHYILPGQTTAVTSLLSI